MNEQNGYAKIWGERDSLAKKKNCEPAKSLLLMLQK